jgi:small subunit ribosomal protein S20
MAHSKSAKKRIRQNERDRMRNASVKARMRTHIKQAMSAIDANDQDAVQSTLPSALSEIDRAAKKGVIHRNSAARKKGMLQRRAAAI